ncbi:peptidyl-prolyl cis-trans isomerase [Lysinibacillus sp. OL1_EC]|uniref:peptidyl-prolyl cis-trans isomerase n=1 Tax=unclassified Lysinibacillus TaxID=2636778 RepID=UPI00103E69B6|nr:MULTISPECIES: peptidyl-prolyl cis-trans isomerase [unclassified Lysinibacillus]MCM0625666.1 peptidyl-prolyl cis-trans isomerase [Lysinibacillus sp. OL1_EC]MCS5502340.1 peptidyl-prolyl cis-trans isomerase [Lysinibacillus sp. A4]TBV86500.1 peptidyl-prolyl cis-trans isomerase [Lysinibacillus sp. OL1]UKJ46226.1 peptidyl-prolyl cis-trans isomerase [Lysinibacillus sp. ACHW1.5]WGT40778.1 peptidyl-prolyl cis-trans isomerase [Lysinibacillus sp. 1 U-2021]
METIIPITGAVTYQLTLDPTVWIFDDRKLDLNTYFTTQNVEEDADVKYMREVGAHWSREIMEGATFPPTLKSERKFDRKGMETGTFGIELSHFLKNAEIKPEATTIVLTCKDGQEYPFTIEEAYTLILKYSQDGKPLLEDGPIHVLLRDGSNIDNPIKNVSAIRAE